LAGVHSNVKHSRRSDANTRPPTESDERQEHEDDRSTDVAADHEPLPVEPVGEHAGRWHRGRSPG
jgi:hypothetical protein